MTKLDEIKEFLTGFGRFIIYSKVYDDEAKENYQFGITGIMEGQFNKSLMDGFARKTDLEAV
jgi:hypothetical protein